MLDKVKEALESFRIDFELGHTMEPYGLTLSKNQCECQNKALKAALCELNTFIESNTEREKALVDALEALAEKFKTCEYGNQYGLMLEIVLSQHKENQ